MGGNWISFGNIRESQRCVEVRVPQKRLEQIELLVDSEIRFSGRSFSRSTEKRYSSEIAADKCHPAREFGFEGFVGTDGNCEVKRLNLPPRDEWDLKLLTPTYVTRCNLVTSRGMILFAALIRESCKLKLDAPLGVVCDYVADHGMNLTSELLRYVDSYLQKSEAAE